MKTTQKNAGNRSKTAKPAALLLLGGVLALAGCAHTNPTMKANTSSNTPEQTVRKFDYEKTTTQKIQYLIYLPEGYKAKSGQHWPLILFLHGAGERGTNIWKVATHGPPLLATNNFDLPFVVVSPQCPEGHVWSSEQLLALLDEVIAENRIDQSRVYLTGLSMGGYGTWNLGLAHPDRFAAIAPICGGGDTIGPLLSTRHKAAHLKALGIWAFHGAKDPVVPLLESERMVDAARRAGVKDVKFTVYPEAGHNAWSQTYTNKDLYTWFLQHQKADTGRYKGGKP